MLTVTGSEPALCYSYGTCVVGWLATYFKRHHSRTLAGPRADNRSERVVEPQPRFGDLGRQMAGGVRPGRRKGGRAVGSAEKECDFTSRYSLIGIAGRAGQGGVGNHWRRSLCNTDIMEV
jgi:hypothetical protein